MIKVDFTHKNIPELIANIDGFSIPYEYLLSFGKLEAENSFYFFYYENELRDFLLKHSIIKFDRTNKEDKEMYVFIDYTKMQKIKKVVDTLFEINYNELQIDFRSHKISNITD